MYKPAALAALQAQKDYTGTNEYAPKIRELTYTIFGIDTWASSDGEKEYSSAELLDLADSDETFADFLQNVVAETAGEYKDEARQLLAILAEYRTLAMRTEPRKPKPERKKPQNYIKQMSGWKGGQKLSWLQAQDRVRRGRTTYIVFSDKWGTYFQLSDMSHDCIYVFDGGSAGVQRIASIALEAGSFERKTGAGEWRGIKIQLMKKAGE